MAPAEGENVMAINLSEIRELLLPQLRRFMGRLRYPPLRAPFNDEVYSVRRAMEIATTVAADGPVSPVAARTSGAEPAGVNVISRSIFERLEERVQGEMVR